MTTVLIVEDDPGIRDLIDTVLTDRGLRVRAVADDRAALRILEREARQIGVLVADVHLGSAASGFDVARRAQKLNPRIEVVYITGHTLDAAKFGVHGGVLLPKPFNVQHLGDMILALAGDTV